MNLAVTALTAALLATPAAAVNMTEAQPYPAPVRPGSVWIDWHFPLIYPGGGIQQDRENPLLYLMICRGASHAVVIAKCNAGVKPPVECIDCNPPEMPAIPLPAAIWSLLAALGGLGFMGWRRK